ncbi:MAG: thiamine phosphate synthase [Nitrospirota bacterium]
MRLKTDTETPENKTASDSRLLSDILKLYLITDRTLFQAQCSMYLALESALKAGVKSIQLREKHLPTRKLLHMAKWVSELTKEYGAKLFINERIDIALAVEAEGVQLGQKSLPAHAVRKISGDKLLIGASTHSIEEAINAERDGADFITLGPIYRTPSKRRYGDPIGTDIIKKVRTEVSIPVLAIGGIGLHNVNEVMAAGADGIAVISAILAARDIEGVTKELLRILK